MNKANSVNADVESLPYCTSFLHPVFKHLSGQIYYTDPGDVISLCLSSQDSKHILAGGTGGRVKYSSDRVPERRELI